MVVGGEGGADGGLDLEGALFAFLVEFVAEQPACVGVHDSETIVQLGCAMAGEVLFEVDHRTGLMDKTSNAALVSPASKSYCASRVEQAYAFKFRSSPHAKAKHDDPGSHMNAKTSLEKSRNASASPPSRSPSAPTLHPRAPP